MCRAWSWLLVSALVGLIGGVPAWSAGPIVPGTGERHPDVGDDFEDPQWSFVPNLPKSSDDLDENTRSPWGRAKNGRWTEGAHRGHPDVVRRVETPPGGIEGSSGALLLQTLNSGVPGKPRGQGEQDDIYMNVRSRIRGHIPVSWQPSAVVRVYVPPFEQWDQRPGSSFAFRTDVKGRKDGVLEPYWPGLFIQYGVDPQTRQPRAYFVVRANERGQDLSGPTIAEFGWWTLGISFTGDGRVHYYASPGVDDLTADDYLASYAPYGFRCEQVDSVFFDIFSRDDGRSWSTPWVIDDPGVYFVRSASPPVATRPSTPSRSAPRR